MLNPSMNSSPFPALDLALPQYLDSGFNRSKYMFSRQESLKEDEGQMAKKGKIPLNPLRIGRHEAVRCMVIICVLATIEAALMGCAGASGENLLDGAAFPSGHPSHVVNSSYNSSAIHLQITSHSKSSDSPASIVAGNGYYSSNPIDFYSPIASRTQVLSKGSPLASLHHSIQSAQEISGSSEYTVSERSYQEGDSARISSTSIGMRIDETVTEGKVSIGAFQADLSSQDGGGQGAGSKMSNPWRKPALEMEEEYIGTFHISRNMSINSNYILQEKDDSLLGHDSVYLNFIPPKPMSISADEVFKCLNCNWNH